jgi:hypothetical protein
MLSYTIIVIVITSSKSVRDRDLYVVHLFRSAITYYMNNLLDFQAMHQCT